MNRRVQSLLWAVALVAMAIMSIRHAPRVGDSWDRVGIRIADEPSAGGGGGGENKNNMFDWMHHRLHDIAIDERHPGENKSTPPRKEYTLDAVPKSGGGLNDDVSGPELPYQQYIYIARMYACSFFALSLSHNLPGQKMSQNGLNRIENSSVDCTTTRRRFSNSVWANRP